MRILSVENIIDKCYKNEGPQELIQKQDAGKPEIKDF